MHKDPIKPYAIKPRGNVGICPKIYMVFLSSNVSTQGKQPDDFLLAVKLTSGAAEKIKDVNPGSYIVKGWATKL